MKARKPALLVLAIACAMLAPASSSGDQKDPCTVCKAKKAEWTWKANGYAIGASSDEALVSARDGATNSACKTSAKYLDAQKLKCASNCNAGELEDACAPEKEPGCTSGTYDSNHGMWTFCCNKQSEASDEKISCDAEQAKKNPGYATCESSVKAVRTLPCVHPDCHPDE